MAATGNQHAPAVAPGNSWCTWPSFWFHYIPHDAVLAAVDAGWKRMALQVLFFVPRNLVNPDDSFREVSNRLLVSPVLRVLVYPKAVEEVSSPVSSTP